MTGFECKKNNQGMTIIEIILVMAISTIIFVILGRLLAIGFPVSKITFMQAHSTETARLQLDRLAKSLRELKESDTGAYPLVEVFPNKLVFYSDVDSDTETERMRYELSGTDLVKGVVKPTDEGGKIIYNLGNEEVSVVATSIQNGEDPVFTYYSGDYPDDPAPLSFIDLTEVKYIQFFLRIDPDLGNDPAAVEVRSQVQLRNLKTNLDKEPE